MADFWCNIIFTPGTFPLINQHRDFKYFISLETSVYVSLRHIDNSMLWVMPFECFSQMARDFQRYLILGPLQRRRMPARLFIWDFYRPIEGTISGAICTSFFSILPQLRFLLYLHISICIVSWTADSSLTQSLPHFAEAGTFVPLRLTSPRYNCAITRAFWALRFSRMRSYLLSQRKIHLALTHRCRLSISFQDNNSHFSILIIGSVFWA
jgi:hypothetical protein